MNLDLDEGFLFVFFPMKDINNCAVIDYNQGCYVHSWSINVDYFS